MTTVRLKFPGPFDTRKPDEWRRYIQRSEQFRVASGLAGEGEPRQVSTLMYCMGEEADGILASTNVTAEERKVYKTVLSKLDGFLDVRRNVTFERARVNRRNKREGESAEQFITQLYALVETCEYGELTDDMLRDRIVVGIRNQTLSQRLQTDPSLTL